MFVRVVEKTYLCGLKVEKEKNNNINHFNFKCQHLNKFDRGPAS